MSRWTSPAPCSASIPAGGRREQPHGVLELERARASRRGRPASRPGSGAGRGTGSPPSSPSASTGTTFGWSIFWAALTSRRKRRRNTSSCESSVVTTFSATGSPPSCVPSKTMPMRPRPMTRVMRYGPSESPGLGSSAISGIAGAGVYPPTVGPSRTSVGGHLRTAVRATTLPRDLAYGQAKARRLQDRGDRRRGAHGHRVPRHRFQDRTCGGAQGAARRRQHRSRSTASVSAARARCSPRSATRT